MLRMDEFNKIRKEFHVKSKSIYQIAREYRRSWATIKAIVAMPEHKIVQRGKRPGKSPIVITPEVEIKINEFLDFEEIHKVHKKQRFTASYIYKKLKEQGDYKGSAKSMRSVVARLRRERKLTKKNTYLNLDFEFGKYLQVDHGPAEVEIDGVRLPGFLFVASVPGACLRFCQFYPTKAQEAWGHFHELLFNFFGGTFSNVIYDNDSVLKINKTGEETQFCTELQIHYKFEAVFCNKASGWEKGAVESAVGFCRRNFLAGIPSFNSFESLNSFLEDECLDNILKEKHYISGRPLYELFDELKNKLNPFDRGRSWGRWEDCRVDNFQHISYQNRNYSVPERFVGSSLKVFIAVFTIDIYSDNDLVYSHERLFLAKTDSLIPDHYLEQLLKKPRAIKHAKVITQHVFEKSLTEMRYRLESRYTEKEAGKYFVQILLLKRTSSKEDFTTSIQLALNYNSISYQGVASILRQIQTDQVRTVLDIDYPNIENHFCLDKYAELEKTETIYD